MDFNGENFIVTILQAVALFNMFIIPAILLVKLNRLTRLVYDLLNIIKVNNIKVDDYDTWRKNS